MPVQVLADILIQDHGLPLRVPLQRRFWMQSGTIQNYQATSANSGRLCAFWYTASAVAMSCAIWPSDL